MFGIRRERGDATRSNVERASERWNYYFDTALNALLDYEMSESAAENSVRKATLVADAALSAFEERWTK